MLTIISVSYKSKEFLQLNYKLTQALNPNTSFQWIVVQNTPESDLKDDLSMDDPRFVMIKGPVLTKAEKECSFYRSIHHAKAINLALAYTDADLILILDPDCFLLLPYWIEKVTRHLEEKKLVFFGTPYHPKYFTHYRNFPNVICLFINRGRMQEHNYFSLDFIPDFEGTQLLNKAQHQAIEWHSTPSHFLEFFSPKSRKFPLRFKDIHLVAFHCLKRWLYKYLPTDLQQRWDRGWDRLKIRSCHDTGFKIYSRYRSLLKSETVSIFALDPRPPKGKLFESILPDYFRIFPRNKTNIVNHPASFLCDLGIEGEQFFWKTDLFGFHLKGVQDHLPLETKTQLKQRALKKMEEYFQTLTAVTPPSN